jgi:solute carrier family 66, member 2
MNVILDLCFIVGPVLGYVDQYRMIKRNKGTGGFSHDVCAILIIANILRIFFRFGKEFENTLLI